MTLICKQCGSNVENCKVGGGIAFSIRWQCQNIHCTNHVGEETIGSKKPEWIIDRPKRQQKTHFELADLDFLSAMCGCFQRGIKGDRVANGWKKMEWNNEIKMQYVAKILRHLRGVVNATSGVSEMQDAEAIACNANIIWARAGDSD